MSNLVLSNMPLTLTVGLAILTDPQGRGRGTPFFAETAIVVPMLNHQARFYLPKQITSKTQDGDEKDQPSDENSWWTRNRTYSSMHFLSFSVHPIQK
jgi:hypothetical protein